MRRVIAVIALWSLAAWAASAGVLGQPKKILVMGLEPGVIKQLETASSLARIVPVTPQNWMSEIADADGFIGNITPEQVRAAKALKWVQTMSAGVERVLHLSGGTDLRDRDIILTNNQIVQGPQIADHAMAMLLALARGLPAFLEHKRQELWQPRPYAGIELNGKTAVIIGVGGIGTQIAFRAWAHGMRVIGVDTEDIPYMPVIERVVKPDQLDQVLPEADALFLAAPHTPLSHKMIGAKQFQRMKPRSYLIAVSRGGLYDLDALAAALNSGHLAGAGVDVVDPEPLPKGHPFWKCENVIITPHVATYSDTSRARMIETIVENIRRFVAGKPLVNVVDKAKGY